MKYDVVVLGAGMIGVSCALHLQAKGKSVILIDRREPGRETSYGNAGLIQREAQPNLTNSRASCPSSPMPRPTGGSMCAITSARSRAWPAPLHAYYRNSAGPIFRCVSA